MYAAKQAGRNAWVESDGIARPLLFGEGSVTPARAGAAPR
jgi:hypothetical protein